MDKPELIIFDLGRVLVDFDFRKVIHRLKQYTPKSEKEIRHYFGQTPLWDAFERGLVSPQDFLKGLKRDLQLKDLSFKDFAPMWNDIFLEKPDVVAILRQLRGRYRLAMISNVNPMHWEHLMGRHEFLKWFEFRIASYEVGHRKPEREIYHLTLRRAGVRPAAALFIDDVLAHIHAANSLGIRSHQFHDAAKLLRDLNGVLE